MLYFTESEVNANWTCGTGSLSFSRTSSNEKERFTSVSTSSAINSNIKVEVCTGQNYKEKVIVGDKTYIVYNQRNYSGRINTGGCSITSEAIVLSAYLPQKNYTPDKYEQYSGYFPRTLGQIASDLKNTGVPSVAYSTYKTTNDSTTKNKAKKLINTSLKNGKPVIALVRAGEDNKFTTSAHYIVLVGYENGNVFIIDPNYGKTWNDITVEKLVDNYIYYKSTNEQGYVLINN